MLAGDLRANKNTQISAISNMIPQSTRPPFTTILIKFLICALIASCSSSPEDPNFQTSESFPLYNQSNFKSYVDETKSWITSNRVFQSKDIDSEISVNLPYEIKPSDPNGKGILLVHGLGDSPFSFIDISNSLSEQGFLVRTILLPGHGSKSGDLKAPTINDWINSVNHHSELMKNDVKELWLGGYSLGANLVTLKAIKDTDIKGLVLFSPAFEPKIPFIGISHIAKHFVSWADIDPENNYTRYNSLPMNGVSNYFYTTTMLKEALERDNVFDRPTFIVASDTDSVVDSKSIQSIFHSKFTHEDNKLLWLGDKIEKLDDREERLTMKLSEFNISTASHMSVLYSPKNYFYGRFGEHKICDNGQGRRKQSQCYENTAELWYSSWGYREPDKIHARLTWNPYYSLMLEELSSVMRN